MTLLKIAQIGHPILRQRAREVTREELASPATQAFIDALIATMRDANGAGLAAIQVYEPVRIMAVEVENNPRYPYKPRIPLTIVVNPVIEVLTEETFENYEGCLSVPNLRGVVDRHAEIRLTGWDREGAPIDRIHRGLTAGTFQHETDHLDGVLFIDRVKDPRSLCTWAEFDRFHKQAFVDRIVPFIQRMER
ncbi:peptide deformylase [Chondromyces apiculatus]|uniref:Peptide deformylase n=1 Tax=Chondromyces apiculatus DSM 436 TaxID=1192034 RepID=A0A017T027_9BACT|nr:peptide deformylase [Chondromyces apiculatus]EYF02215.1 Peptide deformylase [Chondromyces apiculatus DSM 436]